MGKISGIPYIFICVALIITSLSSLGLAATSPHSESLIAAEFLNPDGSLSLAADFSGSLDLEGWDVSLDPLRGPVFQPAAATYNQWTSLGGAGSGLTDPGVVEIEFSGGVLYAGGGFT